MIEFTDDIFCNGKRAFSGLSIDSGIDSDSCCKLKTAPSDLAALIFASRQLDSRTIEADNHAPGRTLTACASAEEITP